MKTAALIRAEQTGKRERLYLAVDAERSGDDIPLTFGDTMDPPTALNGITFRGRSDWKKFTRTDLSFDDDGYLVPFGPLGGYSLTAQARIIIDFGREVHFSQVQFGAEIPSASTLTVSLGSGDDRSGLWIAAASNGPYDSGDNIGDLDPARYLLVEIDWTGTVNTRAVLKSFSVMLSTCKHYGCVTDFGTITARLNGGLSPVVANYSLTTHNGGGIFNEAMAKNHMSGRIATLYRCPEGGTVQDYQTLYSGIVDYPESDANTGRLLMSLSPLHSLRDFPRYKASDFGPTDDDTLLPCPFGSFANTLWSSDPKINAAENHGYTAEVLELTDDCESKEWVFDYYPSPGTTLGVVNPATGYTITQTSHNQQVFKVVKTAGTVTMFRFQVVRDVDAYWHTRVSKGDTISITTVSGGGGASVRVDSGKSDSDEEQHYAVASYPVGSIDSVYDDTGTIAAANYDTLPHATYGGKKIAVIRFKNAYAPTGAVKWAGQGYVAPDGTVPTNPAEIAYWLSTHSPDEPDVDRTKYWYLSSVYDARNYFSDQGIEYSGTLPAKTMTRVEVATEILRHIADVDLSEGPGRMVPVRSDIPPQDEIATQIKWWDIGEDDPKYTGSREVDLMNKYEISWGTDNPYDTEIKQEFTLSDLASIRGVGLKKAHGGTPGIELSLPYATAKGVARAIGTILLERNKSPYYIVDLPLVGLNHTNVHLGDRHIAYDHPRAVNPTSRNIGARSQVIEIIGKRFNLSGQMVNLIGRIYYTMEFSGGLDFGPDVLIWDGGNWDENVWG